MKWRMKNIDLTKQLLRWRFKATSPFFWSKYSVQLNHRGNIDGKSCVKYCSDFYKLTSAAFDWYMHDSIPHNMIMVLILNTFFFLFQSISGSKINTVSGTILTNKLVDATVRDKRLSLMAHICFIYDYWSTGAFSKIWSQSLFDLYFKQECCTGMCRVFRNFRHVECCYENFFEHCWLVDLLTPYICFILCMLCVFTIFQENKCLKME